MIFILLTSLVFLPPNAPTLNEPASPVCACQIKAAETQEMVDALEEKAREEPSISLAANQIGMQKRILWVDSQIFINPEILWKSEEMDRQQEGCSSTPCIRGIVPRSTQILLRWYDRQGNVLTQEFSGYTARLLQHGIDHLDGIRFPDRIADENDLHWVEPDQLPAYLVGWEEWQSKCSRSQWLAMKGVP